MEPFDLRLWDGFFSASNNQYLESTIVDQITIDSRLIHSKNALFIALPGLKEDGHHFLKQAEDAGAAFAIVKKEWVIFSKKSSLKLLYVDNPLHALQEIATCYRKQMKAFVVAITGTHGKTMVKDLLLNMLGSQKNVIASPGSLTVKLVFL
jgi:alanine racemase/UDP-N-acetylmuramoyl-tripeptide--D-alanyl-D-alanine ligase